MGQAISYFFQLASCVDYRLEVDLERPSAGGDLPGWTLLKKRPMPTLSAGRHARRALHSGGRSGACAQTIFGTSIH
jgi:hypothetical protein